MIYSEEATIAALEAIGVDPVKASRSVTHPKSGVTYEIAHYYGEQKGIKLFRVYADGKLKLRAEEQIKAIFG